MKLKGVAPEQASVKDFFISYNRADRTWAEWIAWQLEEAGYSTVLQAWDIRPGSNFVLEMQGAAALAERTIAVLSPDYLTSSFTQPEWAAAFAQDPTGEKGTLVPVRVRECDPKGLLPQIVYIDLVGLDEKGASTVLLTGVQRGRAKPTAPPPFPGATQRSVPEKPRFPGQLPPIWNVPHNRNPNFTGRESLLVDLRAALTSGQPAALTQAISGLGGVGKTQLAVEYAYRHAAEYNLVWWVPSEEPAALAATYAHLAQELQLPEREAADQRAIVQAVRHWLELHPGWLLVFDNAPDPDHLREYLPQGATGHVLVTSRNPNWRAVASPLRVPLLPREEAIDFLLKRTQQDDRAAANHLAEALGDLPLALEQAGAYLEQAGASLAQYLSLFQSHQRQLLRRGPTSPDYPNTVATTWEIAFQRLPPEAAALLNLSAFLAPDAIPRELVVEGAEGLPEPLAATAADPLALGEAVASLRRYSLLEVADDGWSVHRLVQAVARDRLAEEAKSTWAEAAVRLVNNSFPGDVSTNPEAWPTCALLLPHALAAACHAEALAMAAEAAGRLLNQVGLYLRGRAEFAEAKSAMERALAIDEKALGPDHPEVATDINNLGLVLQHLGDLAGARQHFQRALAIDEKAYGPDHPTVAIYVNNLGSVLHNLGDLAGARTHLVRALAIGEKAYGPDHPTVARRVNNLGEVLRALGDLAGARAQFERALAIGEKAYGPDHPSVAIYLNNRGLAHQALGDLAEARGHFERALAIDEKAYGPVHPTVATRLNNLGNVLRALGDLAGAREHFQRALAIDEAVYGPDHPAVATDGNNLGGVLWGLGDLGDPAGLPSSRLPRRSSIRRRRRSTGPRCRGRGM